MALVVTVMDFNGKTINKIIDITYNTKVALFKSFCPLNHYYLQ